MCPKGSAFPAAVDFLVCALDLASLRSLPFGIRTTQDTPVKNVTTHVGAAAAPVHRAIDAAPAMVDRHHLASLRTKRRRATTAMRGSRRTKTAADKHGHLNDDGAANTGAPERRRCGKHGRARVVDAARLEARVARVEPHVALGVSSSTCRATRRSTRSPHAHLHTLAPHARHRWCAVSTWERA